MHQVLRCDQRLAEAVLLGASLFALTKRIALAMRLYQNNFERRGRFSLIQVPPQGFG